MTNFLTEICNIMSLNGVDYKTIKLTDDVVNRWDKVGFLSGLDNNLREKCALSLERMAAYIINEIGINEDGCIKGEKYNCIVAFPCIRRISTLLNDEIMPENIIKDLNRVSKWLYKENIIEEISDVCGYKVDLEAELVFLVVSGFVEQEIREEKYKVIKAY